MKFLSINDKFSPDEKSNHRLRKSIEPFYQSEITNIHLLMRTKQLIQL